MGSKSNTAVWNPVDSDDEGETENDFQNRNRCAELCVIDVTAKMFQSCFGKNGDEKPIVVALKYCHALWRSKIVSAPKDLVGVLLCGSEKAKNSSDFPNLYVLQDLSAITFNKITELDSLVKDLSKLEEEIGSSSECNMSLMLWLSKILFEDANTGSFSKKITYLTCEDSPHSDSTDLQTEAIKKFKDLGNTTDFQVVGLQERFDFNEFYSRILENRESLTIPKDITGLLRITRIQKKRQRPVYHSTLLITSDIKIGVELYSMARRAIPPKPVKINKRNNEVVSKVMSRYRSDTGMPVLRSEEVRLVTVQGENAIFTKDELKSARYAQDTGLTILAFLDQSNFDQFKWFRSSGYFLFPDEAKWTGSKDFFACLLRRCLVLKKCVLVRVVLSRGKTPKIGCLLPQHGFDGTSPQGFYLFMIPFADEFRDLSFGVNVEPSDELVGKMEQIVKKTTQKNFDVTLIENPVIQMKWREIETAVFNNEDIEFEGEVFQDFTEPNVGSMEQRVGELSRQVMARSKVETAGIKPPKKPKLDINMEMEAKNKRLEKLTCEVLKDFLDSVNVDTRNIRRKADLVTATYTYFGKK